MVSHTDTHTRTACFVALQLISDVRVSVLWCVHPQGGNLAGDSCSNSALGADIPTLIHPLKTPPFLPSVPPALHLVSALSRLAAEVPLPWQSVPWTAEGG